jgi:hypothetical protein
MIIKQKCVNGQLKTTGIRKLKYEGHKKVKKKHQWSERKKHGSGNKPKT